MNCCLKPLNVKMKIQFPSLRAVSKTRRSNHRFIDCFVRAFAVLAMTAVLEPAFADPEQLSLKDCYLLALKRSETIAISKEAVAETTAEFLKATGEVFGDVDLLITDFIQDAPSIRSSSSSGSGSDSTSTARERRERKLVISQPLFQGFKSIAALTAAGSLKKQRKEERLRAEQLLFLDVAGAFYDVLKQADEVAIIEGIHTSYEERIKELKEREKIGRSRPSELATAISRMKILEADRARARGAFAIAKYVLEFLIGMQVGPKQLKDVELPSVVSPQLIEPLGYFADRPDVKAYKHLTKIARSGIISAQSELWPEIVMDSNAYVHREGFQKDIDWDVLFKINIPLSRGGENLGNLKEAYSDWKTSKLNYSLAKRQADFEIKEAYQNWYASYEEFEALRDAVNASEENFKLQKEDYAHNLVSNLDVLEALQELFDVRRQANETHYQMKENYWQLQISKGNLNEFI